MTVDLLSVVTGLGFGLLVGLAFWTGHAFGRITPLGSWTLTLSRWAVTIEGREVSTLSTPKARGKAKHDTELPPELLDQLRNGTCPPEQLRTLAQDGLIRIRPASR